MNRASHVPAIVKHYGFVPPLRIIKGVRTWHLLIIIGFFLWFVLKLTTRLGLIPRTPTIPQDWLLAGGNMLVGILIVYGTCEALVIGAQVLGQSVRWNTFLTGTITEILTLLPELVIIVFLVKVSPFLTFLVATVSIYNNALVFSIYSFLLPKDVKGKYLMPEPITKAGTEVLIAGSGIALVIGLVMMVFGHNVKNPALSEFDLIFVGIALLVIFGFYLHSLFRYYSAALEEAAPKGELSSPPSLGRAIFFLGIGVIGAYIGGEAVSAVGDTLVNVLKINLIPSAILLGFFGAIDEYVIIFQAHRQKLMGIALSNCFGGITQVMFLVVPFTLIAIGISGLLGIVNGTLPINFVTTLVVVLLFPVFFVLFAYLEEDHTLNNLDAAGMLVIFILILYALLFMSGI